MGASRNSDTQGANMSNDIRDEIAHTVVHASGGYTIASHDVRVGSEWVPLAMGTEPRVFIDGKRVL